MIVDIDKAVEISRDRDIEAFHGDHHDNLARIAAEAPTLKERFLTDSETFLDFFPDAITGGQSAMAIDAIRPLLNAEDDAELGRYIRGMVMAYIETASREAN